MSSDKHADLTSKLMFPYPNAFQTLDEQKRKVKRESSIGY